MKLASQPARRPISSAMMMFRVSIAEYMSSRRRYGPAPHVYQGLRGPGPFPYRGAHQAFAIARFLVYEPPNNGKSKRDTDSRVGQSRLPKGAGRFRAHP